MLGLVPHQHDGIPLGIDAGVVVILLLWRSDAVAKKGQRQVKLPGATSGQRRVVTAEFKRDHLLGSIGSHGPHKFHPVCVRGPEFRVERHLKRLPARPGIAILPDHRIGSGRSQPHSSKLARNPLSSLLNAIRSRPAAVHFLGSEVPDTLLQPCFSICGFPARLRKTSPNDQHRPDDQQPQATPFTKHHNQPPWL